jgi:hypothetical protein
MDTLDIGDLFRGQQTNCYSVYSAESDVVQMPQRDDEVVTMLPEAAIITSHGSVRAAQLPCQKRGYEKVTAGGGLSQRNSKVTAFDKLSVRNQMFILTCLYHADGYKYEMLLYN